MGDPKPVSFGNLKIPINVPVRIDDRRLIGLIRSHNIGIMTDPFDEKLLDQHGIPLKDPA